MLVSFSYCNCALLIKVHPDHFNYQLVLFIFNGKCEKTAIIRARCKPGSLLMGTFLHVAKDMKVGFGSKVLSKPL